MGLINWLNEQAVKGTRVANISDSLDKVFEATIRKKIEKLKEKGEPVTVDRLMKGWESLKAVGYNEAKVREKIEQILTDS